jgi:hypothetical protein
MSEASEIGNVVSRTCVCVTFLLFQIGTHFSTLFPLNYLIHFCFITVTNKLLQMREMNGKTVSALRKV